MAIKLTPRDYQIAGNNAIFDYFRSNTGNPLVAMPTGTGKSVVLAMFLYSVFWQYPRERVMVLTHVKELIGQNFQKLLDLWPTAPAGVFSAGLGRRDTLQKIIFGGIASVAKKADQFGHVGLLLIDEAHLVSPSDATMYQTFIAELRKVNPQIKVIGFTATPWRLGHGHIVGEDSLFTDVCFDLTTLTAFNWLLSEGYLCPLVPKATTAMLATDGVHLRGGEFIAKELQAAVDRKHLTAQALKETVELAGDRQSWLVFCAGVDHAIHVADALNTMGIPCKAVHSKLPPKERDAIIAEWKSGSLRVVTNNNVLTTGIDHPALDCIVMLRPTASAVLWVQMLGRGTRPDYATGFNLTTAQGRLDAIQASQKHNCLVLDFAGNTRRLGPINDPVLPKKKGEKAGEAPVKLCPVCSSYNHASARNCFLCGHDFPFREEPNVSANASTDELIRGADEPDVRELAIDHITYSPHNKPGKPTSLRVAYYCGLKAFYEYVCPEHPDSFSQRKAREWLADRGWPRDGELPAVQLVLDTANQLRVPTRLRVWVNRQPYPQVMKHIFDTTVKAPQADVTTPRAKPATPPPLPFEEDDIPF